MKRVLDAFDRIGAGEFIRGPRKRRKSKRQRDRDRQIAELARTQTTGVVAPADWWRKYHAYIQSSQWRSRKAQIISQRGSNCERCGVFGRVDLHHITYARLGREQDDDLKLYCRSCHNLMHFRRRAERPAEEGR